MGVKTCVAPAENFLHQGKTDELFPKKKRGYRAISFRQFGKNLQERKEIRSVRMRPGDTMRGRYAARPRIPGRFGVK